MTKKKIDWTDEMKADLERMIGENLSASRISRELSARYGFVFTRNATIGKANRLGLHPRSQQGAPEVTRAPPAQLLNLPPPLPRRQRLSASPPPPQFGCFAITDLKMSSCRYVGPGGYCGRQVVTGKSYCELHLRGMFRPPPGRPSHA